MSSGADEPLPCGLFDLAQTAQTFVINGLLTTFLCLFGIIGYILVIALRLKSKRFVERYSNNQNLTRCAHVNHWYTYRTVYEYTNSLRFEQYLFCMGLSDVILMISAMGLYGFVSIIYKARVMYGNIIYLYMVRCFF